MASYVLSQFANSELETLFNNIGVVNEIFSLIERGEELEEHLKEYSKVKPLN